MKTAMQDLIEYMEEMYSKDNILEVIINKSNKLLEKEKDQIEESYSNGYNDGLYDKSYKKIKKQ
tara:strand:- start:533 stop:724 length:192 start_codon:yes stop_codon:yes gene_type:complete